MNRSIPRVTLQRYPVYLKALRKLKQLGVKKVMSNELAEYVDILPTTIRRDFSLIGHLGKQGYGYDVDELIDIFTTQLNIDFDERIVLIGVGNLGKALLKYNNWDHVLGEITCAFDRDVENITDVDIPLYDIKDFKEKKPEGCRIALLCVSKDVQETVDMLVENGIKGIVDLTHEHFVVPDDVHVRYVDIVSSIIEVVFEVNEDSNRKR